MGWCEYANYLPQEAHSFNGLGVDLYHFLIFSGDELLIFYSPFLYAFQRNFVFPGVRSVRPGHHGL